MGKKNKKKNRSGSIDQQQPQPPPTHKPKTTTAAAAAIEPEDLSLQRHDEETVLAAIYGDDFTLESGAWNCPVYKLRIRPASDVTDPNTTTTNHDNNNNHNNARQQQCELTLSIQLTQKYPYSIPLLQILTNNNSNSANNSNSHLYFTPSHLSDLLSRLSTKATECSQKGEVMGWELGQVCELFLMECLERRERSERRRVEMLRGLGRNHHQGRRDDNDDGSEEEDDEEDHDEAEYSFDKKHQQHEQQSSMDSDTKKEIARQMEALDIAARQRRRKRQGVVGLGGLTSIADNDNDNDEDDDEVEVEDSEAMFDLDQFDLLEDIDAGIGGDLQQQHQQHQQQQGGTTSRYQSDFVELQHLGKGGGGEVVKAINRLDRREYAIKKIFLEPEEEVVNDTVNNKSKLAMMQNEKLRREVVTISRMTHKNIVRYYQAWVEDPPRIEEGDAEEEEDAEEEKKRRESIESKSQSTEEKGNDDYTTSWDDESYSSESSTSSSESDSDNDNGDKVSQQKTITRTKPLNDYSRSHSLDNFLEHEAVALDFANPLFFAGSNELLPSRLPSPFSQQQHKKYSSSNWTDNITEKSRRDERKILYIQMEYCKTTLRDMIDESKLLSAYQRE